MRLKPKEIVAIKASAARAFGLDATVRLFGSRANDARRGGDIDLMIEHDLARDAVFRAEADFLADLESIIGERKVDVLLLRKGTPPPPLAAIAVMTGVVL